MPYVEEIPIVLPSILDGVSVLGDLWDCRSAEKVGAVWHDSNSKISKDYLHVHPRRDQDYRLVHIKSTHDKTMTLGVGIDASLVILKKKINLGGAKYTSTNQTSLTREELEISYDEETFVVRLLPAAATEMAGRVLGGATHILTEIVLGAKVSASIIFEEKVTTTMKDKTASGLGQLLIGPISMIVEAGLSAITRNDPDSQQVTVDFDCLPPLESKPTTIKSAFDAVRGMQAHIAKSKEFTQLEPTVAGAGIRYYLVPVHQFLIGLPEPEPPVYMEIEAGLMEEYMDMMTSLADFGVSAEDVPERDEPPFQEEKLSYFKKLIALEDFRLKPMLYDSANPLTIEVEKLEAEKQAQAKELYETGMQFLIKYKLGQSGYGIEELKALLENYNLQFDIGAIRVKIRQFVENGKRQLDAVHAEDVTDDVQADFITSAAKLRSWEAEGGDLKILVNLGKVDPAPSGVLLAIYELSKHLDPSSIGVSYPNSNVGNGWGFEILLRVKKGETPLLLNDNPLFTLGIISSALGFGQPVHSAFYQIVAASSVDKPIVLPLSPATLLELPALIQTLTEKCQGIRICENFVQFREIILKGKSRKFVAPLDGFESVLDTVRLLFDLKSNAVVPQEGEDAVEWVVTTFGKEVEALTDAPLLLVYKEGELEAVCKDGLDILLLKYQLTQVPINLQSLSPGRVSKTNLYSARAVFAGQVFALFKHSFLDGISVAKLSRRGWRPDGNSVIAQALALTSTYAAEGAEGREKAMVDALTSLPLKYEGYAKDSGFRELLRKNGWSDGNAAFSDKIQVRDISWSAGFQSDILDYIFPQSALLQEVGILYRTLEECIKEWKSYFPPTHDGEAEPKPPYDPVKEINRTLDSIAEKYLETKHKIEELLSSGGEKIQIYGEICRVLLTDVVRKEQADVPGFFHLWQLLDFIAHLIVQASEEGNKSDEAFIQTWDWYRGASNEKLLDILQLYISRVEGNHADIISDLRNGFTQRAIQSLGKLKFLPWLANLQHVFNTCALSPQIAEDVLVLILQLSATLTEDNWEFIWQNSSFHTLISLGINDPRIIEALVYHLCKDNVVPVYIPEDIGKHLKAAIKEEDGTSSKSTITGWTTDWPDLKSALNALQCIVGLGVFPPELHTVLRLNLKKYPQLLEDFLNAKALFFWNAQSGWFDQPWELKTVETAVDFLRTYQSLQTLENSRGLPQQDLVDERDPAELLLDFVLDKFPQYIKKRLIVQTAREENRARVFKHVMQNLEDYSKVQILFQNLVRLPGAERLKLLEKVGTGLAAITKTCSLSDMEGLVALRNRLREELAAPSPDPMKIQGIEEHIRRLGSCLTMSNLQLRHFVREYEVTAPVMGWDQTSLSQDMLMGGMSVDVIDIYTRQLTQCFRGDWTPHDMNVFVICSIGLLDSDIGEVLDSIFLTDRITDKSSPEEELGLHAKLVRLDDSLQTSFGVDGIVLLELSGCMGLLYEHAGSAYQQGLERGLIAFAMASSHLTLLSFAGNEIPGELAGLLEIGMVENLRVGDDGPLLDIILLPSSLPTSTPHREFSEIYERIKTSSLQFPFEFGIKSLPTQRFGLLARRLANEELVYEPNPSFPTLLSILENVSLAAVAAGRHFTLANWISRFGARWENLARSELTVHSNLETFLAHNVIAEKETIVRTKLDACLQYHAKEYEIYISENLSRYQNRISGKGHEIRRLIQDESKKAEVMDLVWNKLVSIPIPTCTPIGDEVKSPTCNYCPEAHAKILELIQAFPHLKPRMDDYSARLKNVIWRRLVQLVLNLDIHAHTGLTTEFERIFSQMIQDGQDSLPPEEFVKKLYEEMERCYADAATALPSTRTLAEDLGEVYGRSDPRFERAVYSTEPPNWTPPTLLLKLQVEDQVSLTLKDYSSSPFHEYGMGRVLKNRVQACLSDYTISNGLDYCQPEIRWSAHIHAIHKMAVSLQEKEVELRESGWWPLVTLANYRKAISDEILERLSKPRAFPLVHINKLFPTVPRGRLIFGRVEPGRAAVDQSP